MLKPPVPENEEARLSALRELEILDTEIEERYERITRSVCRVLDVPISAISLVDTDRQWFKSVQGLGVRETSRDISFCVRRQNIWDRCGGDLAECWPHLVGRF